MFYKFQLTFPENPSSGTFPFFLLGPGVLHCWPVTCVSDQVFAHLQYLSTKIATHKLLKLLNLGTFIIVLYGL